MVLADKTAEVRIARYRARRVARRDRAVVLSNETAEIHVARHRARRVARRNTCAPIIPDEAADIIPGARHRARRIA